MTHTKEGTQAKTSLTFLALTFALVAAFALAGCGGGWRRLCRHDARHGRRRGDAHAAAHPDALCRRRTRRKSFHFLYRGKAPLTRGKASSQQAPCLRP